MVGAAGPEVPPVVNAIVGLSLVESQVLLTPGVTMKSKVSPAVVVWVNSYG